MAWKGFAGALLAALSLVTGAMPAAAAWDDRSFHPTPPWMVSGPRMQVPVLMYHHVSPLPRDADQLRRSLTVTPAAFRAQLEWLRDNGYRTVSAGDLWSALVERRPLHPRSVVLTFDDGYDDAYEHALPLLREFGAVGVFFVVVNLMGREGYVTRDQVRAMADAGMDIESHGMDHVNVAKLSPQAQRTAFCRSREILTDVAGAPVRFFAYPNGDAPATTDAIAGCDYSGAFGKAGGPQQDRAALFALRRTRVPGGAGAAALPGLLPR